MSSTYLSTSGAIQSAYSYFLQTQGGGDCDDSILPTLQGPIVEPPPPPGTDGDGIPNEDSEKPLIQEAQNGEETDAPIQETPVIIQNVSDESTQVTEGENLDNNT